MKLIRVTELIEKYANCQECGSGFIGNGSGTLEVNDYSFKRSCRCGWSIEIKEVSHEANR